MEAASDWILAAVESFRANRSQNSAETPRARRRLAAETPMSLIAFYFILLGCSM
jgi:hypothetical protein